MSKINLSVLDQSQIRRGSNAAEALLESGKLAQLAEQLDYVRFWVSEHHNFKLVAGTAPEVLIPYLASLTKKLRIGSGGIMLPNHSTLKMAENFGILSTLFPGRIDLGIGRAPGGDRLSAYLLNPSNTFSEADFLQQLKDIQAFLSGSQEDGSVMEKVQAYPQPEILPEYWLLTSSGGSAQFAAHLGMGLSFAHFINPNGGDETAEFYRHNFKPSEYLTEPKVNVGIFGFCSEDEEKVRDWITDFQFRMLFIEMGGQGEFPSLEQIKKMSFTLQQQARMVYNKGRFIAGTPDQMKAELNKLSEKYETDEIMIATPAESWEDRKKSYELFKSVV
ncbi:LLM class flavin-dependent oxidoreductase [Flavobacterium silvaticum]|uniref:LLM class flavin-dependent oxidoreductase n=1 Tax=Flavobacterium silvaticum TaxID=1852020 RepID=A0A972FNR6_9FLAO|nr:LLM class flavin-dependent oxidoreductase [Flavobacterium silvaticum]NMH29439.1 LLM class flavin-dependent oxidoreductase [Flavobacterium silvaticum]